MISASLLWSPIPSTSFTADLIQKLRNHSFYNRKLHTFWCSPTLFDPPKRNSPGGASGTRRLFWCPKSPLCGPSGAQKIIQIAERAEKTQVFSRISTIFFITYPFDCFHCRCYAQKYGIIHFTIGNYTLFIVQRPSLAP